IFWMRSNESTGIQNGAKRVYIIWFEIAKIGVFPVSGHGVFRSRYSTEKTTAQSSLMRQLSMFPNFLLSTVQISGLSGKRKIYFQKALHRNIVLTELLRRKKILWMSGLIPDHHMKRY